MISAIKIFFRSLGDLWFNLIGFSVCNLLTFVGTIIIITAPPMWLSLLEVSRESLPYRERPEVGSLLYHAKENGVLSWKLAAFQIVGTVVFFLAFFFYLNTRAFWALPLTVITGIICWTWIGVLIYSGPLLLRSTSGVLVALRNGFVVMVHYPLFTSTLMVLCVPVLFLSIIVPPLFVLVTLSFLAILSTRATNWVLEKEGLVRSPLDLDEDEESEEPVDRHNTRQ